MKMWNELKREWLNERVAIIQVRVSAGEGAGGVKWFVEVDGITNIAYRRYAEAFNNARLKSRPMN